MPESRRRHVEQALFRGSELTFANRAYLRTVRAFLTTLLETDTLPRDATITALGIRNKPSAAQIIAREPGVAAGLAEYAWLMRKQGLHVVLKKEDGDVFNTGDSLVRVVKAWEKQRRARFIEIEVRTEDGAIAAGREFTRLKKLGGSRVHDFPCFVMLDGQMPDDVRQIIVALRRERAWDAILVEASGSITELNAELFAETEVDVISIGALTHSCKALDLSQRPA